MKNTKTEIEEFSINELSDESLEEQLEAYLQSLKEKKGFLKKAQRSKSVTKPDLKEINRKIQKISQLEIKWENELRCLRYRWGEVI